MRYAHVAPTQVADAMAVLNWSDDDLSYSPEVNSLSEAG
jgi:hypothetical protein